MAYLSAEPSAKVHNTYLLIVIAATERRLTPTFPYLKKGTRTQRNRIFTQLASMNLMESNGSTRRQNTKSATQRLEQSMKFDVLIL